MTELETLQKELDELKRNYNKLKASFQINMARLSLDYTHEKFEKLIENLKN